MHTFWRRFWAAQALPLPLWAWAVKRTKAGGRGLRQRLCAKPLPPTPSHKGRGRACTIAALCEFRTGNRRGRCRFHLVLPHRRTRRPCRQPRPCIPGQPARLPRRRRPTTPRRPSRDRRRPLDRRQQRRRRIVRRLQRRGQLNPVTDPAGPKDQRVDPEFGADLGHRLGGRGSTEQLQAHANTQGHEATPNGGCRPRGCPISRSRELPIRSYRRCECGHAGKSRSAPERRCWGGYARRWRGHGSGCRCWSAAPGPPHYSPPHRNSRAASA